MAATSGLAKVNVNDTRFLQREMSWWVINFFWRSNGHMVPSLSLLQSKSIALNEMMMTWRHCCNWAVGDVFTTMSVTDSAMPETAWLKDSICLAEQVCLLSGSRLFNTEFRIPTS